MKVKVAQSCLTLYDPMNCSLPGASVHGILQARLLEWVAIPFSRGSSQPGIEPGSPALQADSLSAEPPGKPDSCHCQIFAFCHSGGYKMTFQCGLTLHF